MSNRTLIELNHDYCPTDYSEIEEWGNAMQRYMQTGDKEELPKGVTFKSSYHHSESIQEAWDQLSERISRVLQGKPVKDFDEVQDKFLRLSGVKA